MIRCNRWLTVKTVTQTHPTREQSLLTKVTYSICTSGIRFPMGVSSENKIVVCVHVLTNTHKTYTQMHMQSLQSTHNVYVYRHIVLMCPLGTKTKSKLFERMVPNICKIVTVICQNN